MKPPASASDDTRPTLPAELAAEAELLQREIDEIALLLRQVRTESERHQARRQQTAQRVDVLLDQAGASSQLREAHAQLLLQAQRAVTMDAQVEVLEGKHKVLQRYAAHLGRTLERLAAGEGSPRGGLAPAAETTSAADSRAVIAGQEEMRRQIARQMHDGPAQSIANIALQAEVLQRLILTDPAAGERELSQLRQMVQHALEETKNFIFDVRPMVLDDLGLVPTLRRAAQDRARRQERPIRFESVGADRRLDPELESALFRIVDDAVAGYSEAEPEEVVVRLNWTDETLSVTVASVDPARAPVPPDNASQGRAADEPLPPALAAMIQEQRDRQVAFSRAGGLTEAALSTIRRRAAAVGIEVSVDDDGQAVRALIRLP